MAITEERDVTEKCLHYCPRCDEEYDLPEDTVYCPICGDREISVI